MYVMPVDMQKSLTSYRNPSIQKCDFPKYGVEDLVKLRPRAVQAGKNEAEFTADQLPQASSCFWALLCNQLIRVPLGVRIFKHCGDCNDGLPASRIREEGLSSRLTESSKNIRAIIYGAGAIGGVIGGHLALAGKEVILIGRPDHVNAICKHGLRFVTLTGTHTLRLPAVTEPGRIKFGPEDVVLLCVKGQNTDEALRDLRAVVEDIPIFCVQNGVRNEEIAIQHFPRVYGVMVRVGGVFVNNGEVIARRDPPGWLIMGVYPLGTDDLVEAVAADLRDAGFYVLVTSEVMPYKWGKLMLNLGNAIGAITNARGDDNGRIFRAARQEAREILSKSGIRWISNRELASQWPEITMQPRSSLDTKAQSSTWQSLARRQGTVETDFLNGEIVRLAESLGTQAPINERLLRIAHEMAAKRELPGKYTPAELSQLVGLD